MKYFKTYSVCIVFALCLWGVGCGDARPTSKNPDSPAPTTSANAPSVSASTLPSVLHPFQEVPRAMRTEAMNGLGTIRNALREYKMENGSYPTSIQGQTMNNVTILNVKPGDLAGKYFTDSGYAFSIVTANDFLLTATGYNGVVKDKTVTLDSDGNWGGTLQ